MKSFRRYLTRRGYSFREIINELTDEELEERVQDYILHGRKGEDVCKKHAKKPY